MANTIDNTDDIINMSDITDRIDELCDERDELKSAVTDAQDALNDGDELADDSDEAVDLRSAEDALSEWDGTDELAMLESLADELQGMGGDHQWEGNWYPGYLIRDSHFRDYAEQLADDIGAIDRNASWPVNCIDWDQAARELQMDYTAVDFDGVTYWVR